MRVTANRSFALVALSIAATSLLAGCAGDPANEARGPIAGTPLDRHQIDVQAGLEVLEIQLDAGGTRLPRADLNRIERFVAAYRDRGHGKMRMAMPENAARPQLAVEAVKAARELAWEHGVAWEDIAGSAYDAKGYQAPLIMSFDVYEAVAPDCKSLAEIDMSDVSRNGELENFGCSVRTNIAAMLADPGDLLGERELGPRNRGRVSVIMEAYRQGEATGAETGDSQVGLAEVGG